MRASRLAALALLAFVSSACSSHIAQGPFLAADPFRDYTALDARKITATSCRSVIVPLYARPLNPLQNAFEQVFRALPTGATGLADVRVSRKRYYFPPFFFADCYTVTGQAARRGQTR